ILQPLDARARQEIRQLLGRLHPADQRRLVESMRRIEEILGDGALTRDPHRIRPPEPGDLGWVVQRHGALYAEEYGWDARFEGLVAGVVSSFVERYDEERERAWIAERDGEPVGSVFAVAKTKTVAKLRLLPVEPNAL